MIKSIVLVGKGYNDTAPVFTYGYDLEGRLATANDAVNGIRTRFVYDLAGRLVRTIGTPSGANGFFATDLSVRYNSKNQVTSRRFGIGSTARTVEYTYDDTGRLTAENHDGASLSYSFDALGRLSGETAKNGTKTLYERTLYYFAGAAANSTGTRVSTDSVEGSNWSDYWEYAYDANGNVTEVWRNWATEYDYTYDDLNQLTAANVVGYTYAYTYDDGGNILTQTKSGLFQPETITYTYGADAWQDLLTGYGGETFTYDEIGNPLTWRNGMTFTWQNGRQLQSTAVGNQSLSFAYNADGIRTKKTVDGVTTRYTLNGTQVLAQQTGTDAPIYFTYDANGRPYSMTCGGTTVYYLCNLSGDVFALLDADGNRIVEYTYGPFGQLLGTYGTAASTLGAINPLRYRGYYYDTETGLYYLNSRYYDPEVGRFINADSAIAGVGGSIQGYNMFAYCMNNPVNMSDADGHWPQWIKDAANWIKDRILEPLKNIGLSSAQKILLDTSSSQSSHDVNARPNTGEPGSTYTAPNGDTRTYGPDGRPSHDYDHNDHGRPDKHPHDNNGGHHHDWDWSKPKPRGPAYSEIADPIIGGITVGVCMVGIIILVADDVTVAGIADDYLLMPLGVGLTDGLIKIFGS